MTPEERKRLEAAGWTAWLIENGKGQFASFGEFGVEWTVDPLAACQFVRRSDAEQMAYGEDCWGIHEHQFGNPQDAIDAAVAKEREAWKSAAAKVVLAYSRRHDKAVAYGVQDFDAETVSTAVGGAMSDLLSDRGMEP